MAQSERQQTNVKELQGKEGQLKVVFVLWPDDKMYYNESKGFVTIPEASFDGYRLIIPINLNGVDSKGEALCASSAQNRATVLTPKNEVLQNHLNEKLTQELKKVNFRPTNIKVKYALDGHGLEGSDYLSSAHPDHAKERSYNGVEASKILRSFRSIAKKLLEDKYTNPLIREEFTLLSCYGGSGDVTSAIASSQNHSRQVTLTSSELKRDYRSLLAKCMRALGMGFIKAKAAHGIGYVVMPIASDQKLDVNGTEYAERRYAVPKDVYRINDPRINISNRKVQLKVTQEESIKEKSLKAWRDRYAIAEQEKQRQAEDERKLLERNLQAVQGEDEESIERRRQIEEEGRNRIDKQEELRERMKQDMFENEEEEKYYNMQQSLRQKIQREVEALNNEFKDVFPSDPYFILGVKEDNSISSTSSLSVDQFRQKLLERSHYVDYLEEEYQRAYNLLANESELAEFHRKKDEYFKRLEKEIKPLIREYYINAKRLELMYAEQTQEEQKEFELLTGISLAEFERMPFAQAELEEQKEFELLVAEFESGPALTQPGEKAEEMKANLFTTGEYKSFEKSALNDLGIITPKRREDEILKRCQEVDRMTENISKVITELSVTDLSLRGQKVFEAEVKRILKEQIDSQRSERQRQRQRQEQAGLAETERLREKNLKRQELFALKREYETSLESNPYVILGIEETEPVDPKEVEKAYLLLASFDGANQEALIAAKNLLLNKEQRAEFKATKQSLLDRLAALKTLLITHYKEDENSPLYTTDDKERLQIEEKKAQVKHIEEQKQKEYESALEVFLKYASPQNLSKAEVEGAYRKSVDAVRNINNSPSHPNALKEFNAAKEVLTNKYGALFEDNPEMSALLKLHQEKRRTNEAEENRREKEIDHKLQEINNEYKRLSEKDPKIILGLRKEDIKDKEIIYGLLKRPEYPIEITLDQISERLTGESRIDGEWDQLFSSKNSLEVQIREYETFLLSAGFSPKKAAEKMDKVPNFEDERSKAIEKIREIWQRRAREEYLESLKYFSENAPIREIQDATPHNMIGEIKRACLELLEFRKNLPSKKDAFKSFDPDSLDYKKHMAVLESPFFVKHVDIAELYKRAMDRGALQAIAQKEKTQRQTIEEEYRESLRYFIANAPIRPLKDVTLNNIITEIERSAEDVERWRDVIFPGRSYAFGDLKKDSKEYKRHMAVLKNPFYQKYINIKELLKEEMSGIEPLQELLNSEKSHLICDLYLFLGIPLELELTQQDDEQTRREKRQKIEEIISEWQDGLSFSNHKTLERAKTLIQEKDLTDQKTWQQLLTENYLGLSEKDKEIFLRCEIMRKFLDSENSQIDEILGRFLPLAEKHSVYLAVRHGMDFPKGEKRREGVEKRSEIRREKAQTKQSFLLKLNEKSQKKEESSKKKERLKEEISQLALKLKKDPNITLRVPIGASEAEIQTAYDLACAPKSLFNDYVNSLIKGKLDGREEAYKELIAFARSGESEFETNLSLFEAKVEEYISSGVGHEQDIKGLIGDLPRKKEEREKRIIDVLMKEADDLSGYVLSDPYLILGISKDVRELTTGIIEQAYEQRIEQIETGGTGRVNASFKELDNFDRDEVEDAKKVLTNQTRREHNEQCIARFFQLRQYLIEAGRRDYRDFDSTFRDLRLPKNEDERRATLRIEAKARESAAQRHHGRTWPQGATTVQQVGLNHTITRKGATQIYIINGGTDQQRCTAQEVMDYIRQNNISRGSTLCINVKFKEGEMPKLIRSIGSNYSMDQIAHIR